MSIQKVVPTYWYRSSNFGDCIAPYLVEKISGHKAVYIENSNMDIEHVALVGSLLDTAPISNTHVWGCGFAYEAGTTYAPKKIYAVRGKLSRYRYLSNDVECPEVYGDPALLLPRYYNPEIQKKYRLGIIPHVADYINVLERYANKQDDVLIISLWQPVEFVISQILSCEKTISSSLHGVVVSHAYGIESCWVEFSDNVLGNGFKFRDYFTTVQSKSAPLDLRCDYNLNNIGAEIPAHEIKANLDLLLSVCPI